MTRTLPGGAVVPTAGDDLLGAWPTTLGSVGWIAQASSVAAARATLTQMEAAGAPPTTAHPAYMDIGGVIYRCDGTKKNGTWVLAPLNEVQFAGVPITDAPSRTLSNGQEWVVTTSPLVAADRDRLVDVAGYAWATVTGGTADLNVTILGVPGTPGHWSAGTSDTVCAAQRWMVPAGTDPGVRLTVTATSGTPTIKLGTRVRLAVAAFPVTMA